jgi:hypothetical protein
MRRVIALEMGLAPMSKRRTNNPGFKAEVQMHLISSP